MRYMIKITWHSGRVTYPLGNGTNSTEFPEFARDYNPYQAHKEKNRWNDNVGVEHAVAIRSLKEIINNMNELVMI